jgi:hypothetical protein
VSRLPARAAALALWCCGGAAAAGAQVVGVAVREGELGAPAAGAVVSLTDSAGRRRASVLTGADGLAWLRAPAPGAYGVRAERVGTMPWVSMPPRPLDPSGRDTLRFEATLRTRAARLTEVVVQSKRTCDALADADAGAASVWQAAQAVLAANALTEADRRVRLRVRTFARDLSADGRVRTEETLSDRVLAGRPFETLAPTELAARGYVRTDPQGTLYYGPDARVLLSEEFANTHCVRAVRGRGAEAGLVGLAFAPLPGRTVPDIEGTLWLDGESSALRRVTFTFVHVPSAEPAYEVPAGVASGEVEFAPGREGAWIVSRWSLRMPKLARQPAGTRPLRNQVGLAGLERYSVVGFTESAGDAAQASASATPTLGALAVTAFDSLAGAPLAGATVEAEGAAPGVTDSAGRATLALRVRGTLAVRAAHPRLRAAGVGLAPDSVRTDADGAATYAVAVPGPERLRALACGANADATTAERGVVAGVLLDSAGAAPAADLPVRLDVAALSVARAGTRTAVRRGGVQLSGRTDAQGRFAFCGVSTRGALTLVRGEGPNATRRALELPAHGVLLLTW